MSELIFADEPNLKTRVLYVVKDGIAYSLISDFKFQYYVGFKKIES